MSIIFDNASGTPPLFFAISYPGTGKTSEILKAIRSSSNHRILSVLSDETDKNFRSVKEIAYKIDVIKNEKGKIIEEKRIYDWKFSGERVFIFNDYEDLNIIADNFRNGVIFFDDYKSFVTSQRDERLRKFAQKRRAWNVFVFMSAHNFDEINPSLYNFAPIVIMLGKTSTKIPRHVLDKFSPEIQKKLINAKIRADRSKNQFYKEIIEII